MAQNTQTLSLQKLSDENANPPYFDSASAQPIDQANDVTSQSDIDQKPPKPCPLYNEEPFQPSTPKQTQEEPEPTTAHHQDHTNRKQKEDENINSSFLDLLSTMMVIFRLLLLKIIKDKEKFMATGELPSDSNKLEAEDRLSEERRPEEHELHHVPNTRYSSNSYKEGILGDETEQDNNSASSKQAMQNKRAKEGFYPDYTDKIGKRSPSSGLITPQARWDITEKRVIGENSNIYSIKNPIFECLDLPETDMKPINKTKQDNKKKNKSNLPKCGGLNNIFPESPQELKDPSTTLLRKFIKIFSVKLATKAKPTIKNGLTDTVIFHVLNNKVFRDSVQSEDKLHQVLKSCTKKCSKKETKPDKVRPNSEFLLKGAFHIYRRFINFLERVEPDGSIKLQKRNRSLNKPKKGDSEGVESVMVSNEDDLFKQVCLVHQKI